MPLFLFNLFGSASIGVYSLATDKMLIFPPQFPETKAQKVGEWLKVKVVGTTIGKSVLIGALACANSNGMVLSPFAQEKEIEAVKSASDINVTVMNTKKTAYGNLILANDYGAIVDPRLGKRDVTRIGDTLGVEVVAGEIAGLPYVGSLAAATNKGVLAHPLLKEEEQKILKDVLKVHVDVGTINCGIPYVATGLIGNKYGAVAGFMTTGPELFIIGQALDVVKENE
ncbi:MAG: translation initiation factor IF-6 [Candidatus Bathyarchaeota archaeon]|nr:translation initiation factor IF-6 [Candidatus Bathyarchaeota archaeon]MDH5623533.1 translation initiation factor IF-6 [Candidatus Bathyarchaeota archaeon]MDH5635798.1 translation initiation factor IF-6 [Candidatus Bathyarchaeota archaeon]MDH5702256.1 translation initiation factor IF-6 [Candidatus Bathyarchaeota archaeon]